MKAGDEMGWKAEGKKIRDVRFIAVLGSGEVCVQLAPGKYRDVPLHELFVRAEAKPGAT